MSSRKEEVERNLNGGEEFDLLMALRLIDEGGAQNQGKIKALTHLFDLATIEAGLDHHEMASICAEIECPQPRQPLKSK